jgi:hypothetical protein
VLVAASARAGSNDGSAAAPAPAAVYFKKSRLDTRI